MVTIVLVLALLRMPLLLTNALQEDAYIHFQHARSLTQTGVFGFNPGERSYGSSSPLYALVAALNYKILGAWAIWGIQFANALALTIGFLALVKALMPGADRRQTLLLVVCISILPLALIVSVSGMETSLLFMMVALLLYAYRRRAWQWSAPALCLLPWIRLDSASFIMIYLFFVFLEDQRVAVTHGIVYALSLLALFGSSYLYFGQFLPQTVIGKTVTYQIGETTLLDRLETVYDSISELLIPLNIKYLANPIIKPIWALTALALPVMAWWNLPQNRRLVLISAGFMLAPPIMYGLSGTGVFKWYLWPSALVAWGLVFALLLTLLPKLRQRHLIISGIAALLFLLFFGQLITEFSNGVQEHQYRGGVGLWIRNHSHVSASVMLEPIGYIGYFSERYIHDETGLISTEVTDFRKKYGQEWWGHYLRKHQPTFLVERGNSFSTYDTSLGNITSDDLRYFSETYTCIKQFHYDPADFYDHPLLLRVLRLGSAGDFNIYVRNNSQLFLTNGVEQPACPGKDS